MACANMSLVQGRVLTNQGFSCLCLDLMCASAKLVSGFLSCVGTRNWDESSSNVMELVLSLFCVIIIRLYRIKVTVQMKRMLNQKVLLERLCLKRV